MAKGRKRPKASVHSASRATESDILAAGRRLAEDPDPVIPECRGSCVFLCPVKRAERRMRLAWLKREDPAALLRAARGGPPLARAFAATLLLAQEKKVPFVGELRLPFGNVQYALRGRALPIHSAGVQHHEDPRLRLLAVKHFVKKRGLHFYSVGNGIVCTAKKPAPPPEFVEEELKALGLEERGKGRWTCEHGGSDHEDSLLLTWRTAGLTAEICAECAEEEKNSLHSIFEHMATPDPRKEFEVGARFRALVRRAGAEPPAVSPDLKEPADAYLKGASTDAKFIEAARGVRIAALRSAAGPLYVAGSDSYGDRAEAFLDALGPSDVERRALAKALEGRVSPVILDRATVARAMAEIWKDSGRAALTGAAGGDEAVANELYRADAPADSLLELVRRAARAGEKARVEAALPRYRRLPGPAAVADVIARAFRAGGRDEAVRVAMVKATETKERGVVLAFLRALKAAEGQDWRFSRTDQEVADVLEPLAKALFGVGADAYHSRLEELARRAGATEPLE